MNHYCEKWIAEWCSENGWTDWFQEQRRYWAFPPHAVLPVPIPTNALQTIKADKGLSPDERVWSWAAFASLVMSLVVSYGTASPMPLVAAFGFCAVVVARLEDEDP
jgi:hypothetical protein